MATRRAASAKATPCSSWASSRGPAGGAAFSSNEPGGATTCAAHAPATLLRLWFWGRAQEAGGGLSATAPAPASEGSLRAC
eukprot:84181-Prymnesium_polylepis.1